MLMEGGFMITTPFDVGLNVIVVNLTKNLVYMSHLHVRNTIKFLTSASILDFRMAPIKS